MRVVVLLWLFDTTDRPLILLTLGFADNLIELLLFLSLRKLNDFADRLDGGASVGFAVGTTVVLTNYFSYNNLYKADAIYLPSGLNR